MPWWPEWENTDEGDMVPAHEVPQTNREGEAESTQALSQAGVNGSKHRLPWAEPEPDSTTNQVELSLAIFTHSLQM